MRGGGDERRRRRAEAASARRGLPKAPPVPIWEVAGISAHKTPVRAAFLPRGGQPALAWRPRARLPDYHVRRWLRTLTR